jgi:hypothetical protein
VVAVDEPGVEVSKEIGRRPRHLGVDGDHGSTDNAVAHVMRRQRVKSLDGQGPKNCVRGDADLGGRVDEGPLADAPELRQWFRRGVGELSRPPEHASHGFPIEEPLSHRRSA